ncbi:MAG: lipoyl synthase [Spirochaetes bacterium]|nr:lipoyl synthase [Spirochaetota bacterium]
MNAGTRKPEWLKVPIPSGDNWRMMTELIKRHGLHSVCDSAHCPNKAECWGQATATFMILGETCTRNCRFCAVATGRTGDPVRPDEPAELAAAVAELGLRYAVITSVDRDDLPDRGASHFAACVATVRESNPGVRFEVLTPDFQAGEIDVVLESKPDVFAHNVETVERLERIRDSRASYRKSLRTLELAASLGACVVKSSIILGLGETENEVLATMDDLRAAGCSSLVLGQYLRPTPAQIDVAEYVTPECFGAYAAAARAKGFVSIVSAPLARTSYHARDGFALSPGAETRRQVT